MPVARRGGGGAVNYRLKYQKTIYEIEAAGLLEAIQILAKRAGQSVREIWNAVDWLTD